MLDFINKLMQSGKSFSTIRAERLVKCNLCDESWNKHTKSVRCGICGCYMNAKTMIPTATCPKDLWML